MGSGCAVRGAVAPCGLSRCQPRSCQRCRLSKVLPAGRGGRVQVMVDGVVIVELTLVSACYQAEDA
jgi:hypothetical protein